jgi:hypothetical protein
MSYHIKNLDILNLDPMLQKIVDEVNSRYGLNIFTCLGRPRDPKCHGTLFYPPYELRAVDMRVRDDQMGAMIVNYINVNYLYDHDRPQKKVAKYHDVGQGKHLHLQTHPNTIERGFEPR